MVTKKLFAISLFAFLITLLSSCGHGLMVRVYFLDSQDKHALVRNQAKEVKPYSEAFGYQCTSPADFDEILFLLAQCREKKTLAAKVEGKIEATVYSLNEARGGLVSTKDEVLSFDHAFGYLCLSPPDYTAVSKIIEGCK